MIYEFKVIDRACWLVDPDGSSVLLDKGHLENYIGETKKFFNGDLLEREIVNKDKYLLELEENNKKYRFKIVDSKTRDEEIICFFSTQQSTTSGKIKKGRKEYKLYNVQPLDNSLPKFVVPYGGKLTGNLAIKLKFVNWDDALPRGEIGMDGIILENNDENSDKIIMHHCGIHPRKYLKFDQKIKKRIEENSYNHLEDKISRIDFNKKYPKSFVFSVDNDTTVDYDDAFSFYEDDYEIIVGIHIAQPIYWLTKEDLDEKMKSQVGTLYGSDSRLDLFGETLTLKSSLKKGEVKASYSTIYTYSKECEDTIIESYPSLITIDENFSYESDELISISETVGLKNFTDSLNGLDNDYHDIVSYWMIVVNTYIGNKLLNYNNVRQIPYRVDDKCDVLKINIKEQIPENIKGKIIGRTRTKARYEYPTDGKDCIHHQLGKKNYCHFTSPIRRIIDTYIHYLLTYNIDSILDIDVLNKMDSKTRKFHGLINTKLKIKEVFGTDYEIDDNIWICNIINNNSVEVYLEKLMVFKKISIHHPKFDYMIDDIIKKNDEDGNISSIELIAGSDNYSFCVNSKYNVKIFRKDESLPNRMLLPFYLIDLNKN